MTGSEQRFKENQLPLLTGFFLKRKLWQSAYIMRWLKITQTWKAAAWCGLLSDGNLRSGPCIVTVLVLDEKRTLHCTTHPTGVSVITLLIVRVLVAHALGWLYSDFYAIVKMWTPHRDQIQIMVSFEFYIYGSFFSDYKEVCFKTISPCPFSSHNFYAWLY